MNTINHKNRLFGEGRDYLALSKASIKLNDSLSKAFDIQRKIERDERTCARLHLLLISGQEKSSYLSFIEKTIHEKTEEIFTLKAKDLPKAKIKLGSVINSFSLNKEEKNLLRYRYIETLHWKYVASKISYSLSHTKHLWENILNKL